jgi:hypothetical protein
VRRRVSGIRLHSRIARRVAIRIIGVALKLPEQVLRDMRGVRCDWCIC